MATNILALPLVQLEIETGNNEDWIDSILFLVAPDDPDNPPPTAPQLDLRGIEFEMEIRREADDHEVILNAHTDQGTLAIGASPNFGYLLINVPLAEMQYKFPGGYVGDIRATADGHSRVVVQLTQFNIIEGVTKSP